ncbi:MAG TPA: tetratricopeptide repeat protein [Candidatus Obscuribacterales bacterium]
MSINNRFRAISLTIACLTAAGSLASVDGSPAWGATKRHIYKGRVSRSVAVADQLLVKGKYARAADYYRAALSRNPQDLNAAVGLGLALGKQFKLDAAEEQFDRVLARDPSNPGAHSGKAMVMLYRLQSSSGTVRRSRESMLQQAEEASQRALQADPEIPEAHYTLGMVYKEQGKLADAAREFREATQIDPRYSDGYTGLGLTKLAQKNIAGAIADFRQAIRLNSGDSTAHYGLGQSYLQQGQVDAALKELNIAQYQFPNSWPVRLALGKAYETQGNTVAAVREYQESIRIKPENPAAYLGIANIREARGDIEHSIAELRGGLELMPDNPELRLRIADQSLRIEKLDDAIKEYETVLTAYPGSARAAEGLTTAYYLKAQKETTGGFFGSNDYERAEEMLNKAVQMNPNDIRIRLAQAKLRSLTGETVDISTIRPPQNDGERIGYAEALLAQNRFQEASEQMSTVIGNARDAKQTFAIADLALMIRDLDSAEAAYKKAATFPGGEQRARRGLAMVAKAREAARKDLTFADDLARKKMLGSAIDKYHDAVFANPKVAKARLGLARALEDVSKPTPQQLREAAIQYRAYVALEPTMPVKEREKFTARAQKLDDKAYKVEQRTRAQAAR